MEFSSNGKGNLGVTLGAIGTGLGVLNGGLGGLLNTNGGCCGGATYNGGGCSENQWVNRYELSLIREQMNKDMEIAYLKGRDAAKSDSLELYRYIDGKNAAFERELADQRVYNAANTGAIFCIQGQIAQLLGLTKTIIPSDNICPKPMPQYNSWTAPTTGA